jgi:hypothetical protein
MRTAVVVRDSVSEQQALGLPIKTLFATQNRASRQASYFSLPPMRLIAAPKATSKSP